MTLRIRVEVLLLVWSYEDRQRDLSVNISLQTLCLFASVSLCNGQSHLSLFHTAVFLYQRKASFSAVKQKGVIFSILYAM